MSRKKITVKQYTSLTNREKKDIIEAVERGEKKKSVAEEFGIPKSILYYFLETGG